MGMGRRKGERQQDLFVPADKLQSAGHPFSRQLNRLLAEAGFHAFVEAACKPYHACDSEAGRQSVPPGIYFRMLFVGYFEGIDSQRGIDWRCADSLALRECLAVPLGEATPDHSTMSVTRARLPEEVHDSVFEFVLKLAADKKLLDPKTIAVDSTLLEADAAMKSIVRRHGRPLQRVRQQAGGGGGRRDRGRREVQAVRQEAEGQEGLERGSSSTTAARRQPRAIRAAAASRS